MSRIVHVIVAPLAALLVAFPAFAGELPPVAAEGWMYWAETDGNVIKRAQIHGDGTIGSPEVLFNALDDGVVGPLGMALDADAGMIYWTQGPSLTPSIRKGPMNGRGPAQTILGGTMPEELSSDIAFDLSGGKMYWVDVLTIRRANLDGSQLETWFAPVLPVHLTSGLAIDPISRKLYWGILPQFQCGQEGKIQRAGLDQPAGAVQVEDVITTSQLPGGPKLVTAMAIDPKGDWLYWGQRACGNNAIYRAHLDGTAVQQVASAVFMYGLAFDPVSQKLYRAEDGIPQMIRRSNTDGTSVEPLIGAGLQTPQVIAVVTAPAANPHDLNGDGHVNGIDIAILLGQWTGVTTYSPCPPTIQADLNGDCKVNGIDLALILGAWAP